MKLYKKAVFCLSFLGLAGATPAQARWWHPKPHAARHHFVRAPARRAAQLESMLMSATQQFYADPNADTTGFPTTSPEEERREIVICMREHGAGDTAIARFMLTPGIMYKTSFLQTYRGKPILVQFKLPNGDALVFGESKRDNSAIVEYFPANTYLHPAWSKPARIAQNCINKAAWVPDDLVPR